MWQLSNEHFVFISDTNIRDKIAFLPINNNIINNSNSDNNDNNNNNGNNKEYLKRIGVNVRLEVIQKTALLGTAKILWRVLSL